MATSMLALLDDIVGMLDDVAAMSKVASKKTAGIVGDDLAVSANQLNGFHAKRELPVVWAVAKRSLVNKIFLVPIAMLVAAFLPSLIPIILVIGGLFLCYEATEKLMEHFFHKEEAEKNHINTTELSADQLLDLEKTKIKGAIRTDAILSLEIIVIALGSLPEMATILSKTVALSIIAFSMTIVFYGLVAFIIKIDDIGFFLLRSNKSAIKSLGQGIVNFAPWLMRVLTVVGTLAMFSVGGDIAYHNIPLIYTLLSPFLSVVGSFYQLTIVIFGFLLGLVTIPVIKAISKGFKKLS